MARDRLRDPGLIERQRTQARIASDIGIGGRVKVGNVGGGGGGFAALTPPAIGRGNRIEHVTLHAEESQTIASGGAGVTWDRIAAAPTELRGFASLVDDLADTGAVVAIPVDVTGDLELTLSGKWGDYPSGFRCSGTLTITRTRAGITATKTKTLTPAARNFDDVQIAWDVRSGDHLTVTLPNDSGADQTLAEAALGLRIIELSEPASRPTLIGTAHGFGDGPARPTSATVNGIPSIRPGDLLVAYLSTAEPTITPPAGWTAVAVEGSGDFKHGIYTRTAQAGDADGSWTWSATGGASGQLTINVLVAVLPGVSLDQYDLGANTVGGTSVAAQVVTSGNARLLMFGGTAASSAVDHSVSGMDKVIGHDDTFTSGTGGTATVSLFDAGYQAAGTHPYTMAWSSTSSGGVALMSVA